MLLSLLAAVLAGALGGCGAAPRPQSTGRVVVLGFDGADPGLVARWINQLPHIRALGLYGTVTSLATTNPPESPVAWASFATGENPGKTGIFDFLKRDPRTYFPRIALVSRRPGRFFLGFPIRRPVLINERHGVPFYQIAGQAGLKTAVIRMPLSFPAHPIGNAELLAGLGVPDVRGTWGTFFYFATDLPAYEAGDTEFGGKLVRLARQGDSFATSIEGPNNPTVSPTRPISLPLRLAMVGGALQIAVGKQRQTVAAGHWSGWMHLAFPASPFLAVHAVTRFYVEQVAPEVRLYMSPLSFDPDKPAVPLSYPSDFARRLSQHDGLEKTLGWWNDTWALNEGKLGDGAFLADLNNNMSVTERMTLDVLDHDHPDLTVAVFTATDSVSHMFYRFLDPGSPAFDPALARRYGDAILDVYRRMDEIIGQVERRLKPSDTLIVVSDHGFHTWRRGFNTNTWLVANGYMTLKRADAAPSAMDLRDLYDQGSFFPNVDWSRTRAYALGLGQIYLNLSGREAHGIVPPGAPAEALRQEIARRLLAYRDPDTGEHPVAEVSEPEKVYHGPYAAQAADLQLGFRDGYRTSWQTALGGIPNGIVVLNTRPWSGDHCASVPRQTPGIFFSNRRLEESASILDIAPTVLALLQLKPPSAMDGHPLRTAP